MLIRYFKNRLGKPRTSIREHLGPGQCQHLAKVIAGIVPDWSVELQCDDLGDATIVILPDDCNDSIGSALVVRRDDAAFRLEELCGDTHRKLGEHREWVDLLCAVRIRLISETQFPTAFRRLATQTEWAADAPHRAVGAILTGMNEGVARHEIPAT